MREGIVTDTTQARRRTKPEFKIRPAGADRYRCAWRTRNGGPIQRAIVPHAAAVAMRDAWKAGADVWHALAGAFTPARHEAAERLYALIGQIPGIDVDALIGLASNPDGTPIDRVAAVLAGISDRTIPVADMIAKGESLIRKSRPREENTALYRKAAVARAASLSPEQRQDIARRAGAARWRKYREAHEVQPPAADTDAPAVPEAAPSV
jgi:hypothetical protein